MHPIEALHRRAAARGFTLTPQDADQCNVSRSWFSRHMRALGWAPHHRALWLPEDLPLDHLAAAQLAVRAIGPPVAATGQTALWLDGVVEEPPPVVQLLVPDGRRIDGPPHLLAEAAARDRRRDRRLKLHGWHIDRFLWTDVVERPDEFVRDVRAAVDQRPG